MFADGLLSFEIRMTILLVGLVVDQLVWATAIIAVGATYTVLQRLIRISKKL